MLLTPLMLLALLPTRPADDPAALIARLGSAAPAEQAAATGSLQTLGRGAIPALEQVMKGTDPVLRARATPVWESIQHDLVTRASMVRLVGSDRLGAVENMAKQTGMALKINQGSNIEGRVLADPTPIPFWTALERLGFRGFYLQNPGHGELPELDIHQNPLYEFTATSGPFRVALTDLHLHHDRQLIHAPWVRVDGFGQRINVIQAETREETITYFGDLDIMAEPRFYFTQEAPVRLTEATDDLGQSLVPDATTAALGFKDIIHFATRGASGVTQAQAQFRLRVPTRTDGTRASLRGVVPLMIHVRRPDPALVIPLAGAVGKTFRTDEVEIKVESASTSAKATNVGMVITLDVARANLPPQPDNPLTTSRLQVLGQHQLQLVAADGTIVADSAGSGYGGGNVTPNVHHWNIGTFQTGPATHLRFYSMFRVPTEVAFEFRDVPLP